MTVVLPLTYAMVNGQRWSWCESKMHRLAFKKSIADAAVDGVVPEGHLRSPQQALQDVMAWLERLDSGQVEVVTRERITVPLPNADPADVKRRQARYGDFSRMNRIGTRDAVKPRTSGCGTTRKNGRNTTRSTGRPERTGPSCPTKK